MKLMLSCWGGWELVHTTCHQDMLRRGKGLLGGAAWGKWWPESSAYNECGTDRRQEVTLIAKELTSDPGPWQPCIIQSVGTSHGICVSS